MAALRAIAAASNPYPYGVADWGITSAASNATGYSYATNAFLGSMVIRSMDATYPSHPGATFQLNAELVLSKGSTPFVYWVQNVPFIYPQGNYIELENNIWNWTSTAGAIPAGSIVGNGTDFSTGGSQNVYITSASASLPGNNVSLTYPATVLVLMRTGEASGVPYVDFEYRDGFGWQTYDNATFPWATLASGWTNYGFVVDGTQRTPIGTLYDAEWVYAGPGSGIASTNVASNITMDLEYDNGHNFQAVPYAVNIGYNTGERMYNVLDTPGLASGAGVPSGTLTVGTSAPAMLYSASQTATLEVASFLPTATLSIGGTNLTYRGSAANVTLSPGAYEVILWNGSKAVAWANVTLTAGEVLSITLKAPAGLIPVDLAATGLPASIGWSVVIGSSTYQSVSGRVDLNLSNGNYSYRIVPIAGYTLPVYQGVFSVAGQPVDISVVWSPFVAPLSVNVSGLPATTLWTLTIGSLTGNSTTASNPIVVNLQNGTYLVNVSAPYYYVSSAGTQTLTMTGTAQQLTVAFGIRYARVVGTVRPENATVTVNGTALSIGSGGSFSAPLIPGWYYINASAPGYVANSHPYWFTPGNATSVNLTLTLHPSGPPRQAPPPKSSSNGSSTGLDWVLVGGIVIAGAAVVAAAALLFRRRGPPR